MAHTEGKPDTTLSELLDQLKSDGRAWASAERRLFRAKVSSRVRRVEVAALMAVGALMAAIAASVTLANVLVASLTPSLGPVMAGLAIGFMLIVIAGGLIAWIRTILHTAVLKGRTQDTARTIWSALNEPN
ncbi:phage holin family protein [Taklimakanibacter lacteus]|uniref:phage holin family protein n=1 Tax=Taklimakanibacter lacteus TaxID=2268456 RepID=UPI000E66064C